MTEDDFKSPIAPRPSIPTVRAIEGISYDEGERARRRRRSRSRRHSRRRDRTPALLSVAIVLALAVLVGVAYVKYGPSPDRREDPAPARAAETVAIVAGTDAAAAFSDTFDPTAEPTPVFASYRSLRLNLPVPLTSLTAIAYHQASNGKAMPMESLLPNADMGKAAKLKKTATYTYSTTDTRATVPDGVPSILKGEVLRLWRSHRVGSTDRCADVGATPGTTVYSPVTGTVQLVRPYQLYQKYPDFELHIRPDGWPEVDCVLIHITDLTVKPGDRVIAGVTPVAEVRLLSNRLPHQLADYVKDGGDHVHVQLNKLEVAGKIEIEGKIYNVEDPGATITVTPKKQ